MSPSSAVIHVPAGQDNPALVSAIEKALLGDNLSELSPPERLALYRQTCESLGLNPLTKPFAYLELNNKLTMYAKKDCTDQLRKLHTISIKIVDRSVVEGVYAVTAQAATPDGRTDESIGAVPIVKEGGTWRSKQDGKRFFEADGTFTPLRPEDRANCLMKAETKAKRRVTLSICGLGMLDESELDTVRGAKTMDADAGHRQNTEAEQAALAQARIADEQRKVDAKPKPEKTRLGDLMARCTDREASESVIAEVCGAIEGFTTQSHMEAIWKEAVTKFGDPDKKPSAISKVLGHLLADLEKHEAAKAAKEPQQGLPLEKEAER